MKKYFRKPTLLDYEKYFCDIGISFVKIAFIILIINVFKGVTFWDIVELIAIGFGFIFLSGGFQVAREIRDERKGTADKT